MYDYRSALDSINKSIFKARRRSDMRRLKIRHGTAGAELALDCSSCSTGSSSMSDPACRRCAVSVLSSHGDAGRLLLERDLVREYSGDTLSAMKDMAAFCGDLEMRRSSLVTYGCGRCDAGRKKMLGEIVEVSRSDASAAATAADRLYMDICGEKRAAACDDCRQRFAALLGDMAIMAAKVRDLDYAALAPCIMPRFSRSRVLERPPPGSVFLRSYEVEPDSACPVMRVALYGLPGSPEKLYFAMPWEYAMDPEDLSLIVEARERLLKRRPGDDELPRTGDARAYFARHAKSALAGAARATGIQLETGRLERLAATFVKYTSGLGIMEDVLADPHIQDAYVNAPVGATPLHVVVDGEECTSNLYLSESDVESMISAAARHLRPAVLRGQSGARHGSGAVSYPRLGHRQSRCPAAWRMRSAATRRRHGHCPSSSASRCCRPTGPACSRYL